jgi:mono/diheme cytochrome c family protein
VTEVPDYLLRRSRERREALGLAPTGGDAPEGGAPEASAPAEASASAASEAPVPAAPAEAPVAAASATEALPAYIEPSAPRSGVPVWMMPILVILPLWAIVYVGAFGAEKTAAGPPNGAQIYTSSCASCHGPKGEGAVGPKLAGGETKLTFPDEAEHIKWVEEGSQTSKGKPYGDPARGKVAASGGMPPFKSQLSPEEIKAVVTYERDQL